jgi:hypothetical protein
MSRFASLLLDVDKPGRMAIRHPATGEPMTNSALEAAYVDVYSSDSEIARKHQRAIGQRRFEEAQRRRKRGAKYEEFEEANIDFLVALTAGWRLVGLDGGDLDVPFNKDAARELYSEPGMTWLRDQVEEFAGDRANFSKASPTS